MSLMFFISSFLLTISLSTRLVLSGKIEHRILQESSISLNAGGVLIHQDYIHSKEYIPSLIMILNKNNQLETFTDNIDKEDGGSMLETAGKAVLGASCGLIDLSNEHSDTTIKNFGNLDLPRWSPKGNKYSIRMYSRNFSKQISNHEFQTQKKLVEQGSTLLRYHKSSHQEGTHTHTDHIKEQEHQQHSHLRNLCLKTKKLVFIPLPNLLMRSHKVNVKLQSASPDDFDVKMKDVHGHDYVLSSKMVDLLPKLMNHLQETLYHYRPYNRQFESVSHKFSAKQGNLGVKVHVGFFLTLFLNWIVLF